MKEGKYWSEREKRFCWVYPATWAYECDCCGRVLKKGQGLHLVYDDDEQGLEYTYGSTCINKLDLKQA